MIGHTLQPGPLDSLDVNIVESGELVAHDEAGRVPVLTFIGDCGECVTKRTERDPVWPWNIQVVYQCGECLCYLGLGGMEHKRITHIVGERFYSFLPQRYHAERVTFFANRDKLTLLEVNIFAHEPDAISRTEASVDPEQNYWADDFVRSLNKRMDMIRVKKPMLADGPEFRDACLGEPLPNPHRISYPPTLVSMVEHGDDAGPVAVESERTQLALAAQVTPERREVIGSKVGYLPGTSNERQQSPDGAFVAVEMMRGNVPGVGSCPLLGGEQVGEFLQADAVGVDGHLRHAPGVQVALDAIVLSQGGGAVAPGPEVVEPSLNSLLKSPVGTGFSRECFKSAHAAGLSDPQHGGSLGVGSSDCNGRQLSSQADYSRIGDMENQPQLPYRERSSTGKSRGLISLSASPTSTENSPFPRESTPAESAQTANSSRFSRPLNTECYPERRCRHCQKQFWTHKSKVGAFCSVSCKSAAMIGQYIHSKHITAPGTKQQAHNAQVHLTGMLRNGTLVRAEDCQLCGLTKPTEGHHPNYTQPWLFVWLCVRCHRKVHSNRELFDKAAEIALDNMIQRVYRQEAARLGVWRRDAIRTLQREVKAARRRAGR